MTYDALQYQTDGPVARVTLDRPRYRNAQSRLLLEHLDAAFTRAVDDNDIRVIVLTAAGEHFSAGHDLGTDEEQQDRLARPGAPGLPGAFDRAYRLYIDASLRWRDLPKPTIAAVQGYCIFGGFIIVSAMDLVIAADDARFLSGPVQFASVPWEVGVRKAKELLLEGRFITAEEAAELGFVNRVVPRATLEEHVDTTVGRIAELDPFAARMIKKTVNDMQDAMGYRNAIQAGFSNFMLMQAAGRVERSDSPTSKGDATPKKGKPRLGLVDRALRYEQADTETPGVHKDDA